MSIPVYPLAVTATEVTPNPRRSILPEPFAARRQGREKRRLGDLFGLSNFGVNIVSIEPNGNSSLLHRHQTQDEFVYVLSGHPVLRTSEGSLTLGPGMCAGFKAGSERAHQLHNPTHEVVWYLEVGDRSAGDHVTYPEEDLQGDYLNGVWVFTHKDGRPY